MSDFNLASCLRFLRQPKLRAARRSVVAVVGGSVVLVGVAMIVLPGPAFLVIPAGLAILATEFLWAKRWMTKARALLPGGTPPAPAVAPPDGHAWHQFPIAQAVQFLEVDLSTGLTAEEVRRRQKKHGPNRVTARPGPPDWLRFLRQFHQPLVYILLVAVGVTAYLAEWVDASVILVVVLVNAVVGFLQEAKAEKSIAALSRLLATETTVRRDGRPQRIPSAELVPGDVVLLAAGDRVPADLRLTSVRQLHLDESALTGESLPVAKHPDPLVRDTILAERKNLAYAGTLVTRGQAESVVWAIGDHTETGHIAGLIAGTVELATPLTRKIAKFSQLVLWVIVALAVTTFTLGVARGEKPVGMFMAAVALAVSAIPEGLPAAVTIVLAIGVSRMAKRQAIIRKLPAVETLGSTTVICTDKTGTLTENQMTVQEIFAGGKRYAVSGGGYEAGGELRLDGVVVHLPDHPALAECLRAGVLCNEARLEREDGRLQVQGDPTEAALLVSAGKAGLIRAELQRAAPVLDTIPFESEQMFRASLHETHPGRVIYKVGALERLLACCSGALDAQNTVVPLDREAVQHAAETMAARGLRVLALARRPMAATLAKLEPALVTEGFTFLGLQAMMDPPRPAVIASVQHCQRAGIAVKMITGDHLVTARAIAGSIGLQGRRQHGQLFALSGRELEKIPEGELPEVAERTAVFARVAPEQKLRIVRALQAHGHVVAMTGDGVNDAPALKQADIGIAMGRGGTDVAKGAAAMILTDDNFASIEAAVEEGRGVFDNLTKFIAWIIPTNLGEALILLAAIVLGLPLPLLPLQLLWINLTDTLLGLSLAFEPRERDVMSRPPRPPQQPLLTLPLIMRSGLVSLIMVGGGLGLFLWELHRSSGGLAAARTVAVNTIVLVQLVYLFNCRSLRHSVFALGWFTNRWVILGSLVMLGAQLLFTYVPVMNRLFHSAPLDAGAWLRIAAVAAFAFVVVELEKWLRHGRRRGDQPRPPAPGALPAALSSPGRAG